MACWNVLCRRLKKLFSKGEKKSSCGATVAGCCIVAAGCAGDDEKLEVNVNPFAPIYENHLSVGKSKQDTDQDRIGNKKSSSESYKKTTSEEEQTVSLSLQPLDLRDANVSRYKREFHELEEIGNGEFGSVYRCLNRLDGCVYAVKRSKPITRSQYAQRRVNNEIHANAVLNNHRHVVKYFSAWIEDDRMNMQLEYCNQGDLAEVIGKMKTQSGFFEEKELCRLVIHVAEGLRYIHNMQLAHMDIKPENIFVSKERIWSPKIKGSDDGDFDEEIVYKIGDLGHITSVIDTQELEDEGDCRYLSKEILRDDFTDLTKADIFALGLTIYELAGGGPLPKNGPRWHQIRDGKLKRLTQYSDDLNELIRIMIHPDPKMRPTATDLMQHKVLLSDN